MEKSLLQQLHDAVGSGDSERVDTVLAMDASLVNARHPVSFSSLLY